MCATTLITPYIGDLNEQRRHLGIWAQSSISVGCWLAVLLYEEAGASVDWWCPRDLGHEAEAAKSRWADERQALRMEGRSRGDAVKSELQVGGCVSEYGDCD